MTLNTAVNAAEWVVRYRNGENLSQIGASVGVTRERVRQILVKQGRMDEVHRIQKEQRAQREEEHEASLASARAARRWEVAPRTNHIRFTNAEIVKGVRDWIAETGSTSVVDYAEYAAEHGLASAVLVTRRLGWAATVQAAGFTIRTNSHHRKDRIPDAEVLAWVVRFLTDPDEIYGGAAQYDKWQRGHDGAPSVATVINRYGRWARAKQAAVGLLTDADMSASGVTG